MGAYWKGVWVLFAVFVAANTAYLHRVPGLMGDEASEGENVYEKLVADSVLVRGERSYIGPAIDYARVPFIKIFGYTPLALRIVVVGFSLGAFWLAALVFRRLLEEFPALFGLTFLFFSPIYLTQQRLGWAITLMSFFGLLLLFVLTRQFRYQSLVAGLVAGVGLSNHILFLPTLGGIVGSGIVYLLLDLIPTPLLRKERGDRERKRTVGEVIRSLFSYWPALIGLVVGFGMQFFVLLTQREDQGDIEASTQLFSQRLADLPDVLPLLISGSSYVARYTGMEFAPWAIWVITLVIAVLTVAALVMRQTRKFALLWTLGIAIQVVVLMYMVDRYSLRYFVVPVLAIWTLAGVGLGSLAFSTTRFWLRINMRDSSRFAGLELRIPAPPAKSPEPVVLSSLSVMLALLLVLWTSLAVLLPFLRTGGSMNEFSLGNRTDTAAALVDTRDLFQCLRREGSVSSENIHILNRLQFASHRYHDLVVLPEEAVRDARWIVEYRDEKSSEPGILCPELKHFLVIPNRG